MKMKLFYSLTIIFTIILTLIYWLVYDYFAVTLLLSSFSYVFFHVASVKANKYKKRVTPINKYYGVGPDSQTPVEL